jgi:hypothetical protein
MRFRLRTLFICVALMPPALAGAWGLGTKLLAEYRARLAAEDEWTDIVGPGSVATFETKCDFGIHSDSELPEGAGPAITTPSAE